VFAAAQNAPRNSGAERTFAQPVADVQAALKKLSGGTSGRLPILDGFVVPGPQPLSGYQRPYYQCEVHVAASKSGGSLVHVIAKITAWLNSPTHSGYQELESNGRVETDLLDHLQETLAVLSASKHAAGTKVPENRPAAKPAAPDLDAPVPQLPDHPALSSSPSKERGDPPDSQLQQEAKSLEEILRNQSHPTNLIAIKMNNTPVLQSPAADAKVLFLASAEDEFEVLEENPGWVHVRISGLSRGWLRRSMVEMPEDSKPRSGDSSAAPEPNKGDTDRTQSAPFSVSSEEMGSFPGDWAPLRGRNVKIISIQQKPGTGRITSPQEKKQFALAIFKRELPGLAAEAAGLALVFDAEDGGMVATSRAALEQWNSGKLSESAFWKQCLLDPQEILGAN
jgi:hypothetical protein